MTVYTLFYFLHDSESINNDKNDDQHTSTPCLTNSVDLLMTSQSIADDVTKALHDATIVMQALQKQHLTH